MFIGLPILLYTYIGYPIS